MVALYASLYFVPPWRSVIPHNIILARSSVAFHHIDPSCTPCRNPSTYPVHGSRGTLLIVFMGTGFRLTEI